MTTLERPDGSFTSDLNENVSFMIDYLIPKDEQIDDTDYHKRIRAQTEEPILQLTTETLPPLKSRTP